MMRTFLRVAAVAVFLTAAAAASISAYWLGYVEGMQENSSEVFVPAMPPASPRRREPAGRPRGELSQVTRSTVEFDAR